MTEPAPEKKEKRESKLPVEVNEDEFIELMEATNKIHHKIAFLLAWESGLRISEVINLRPEHINEKEKTKKPTVHFHSLRHGYATHCVRQGVKLPFLQVMLGHSDLATTSVYLRVAPIEAATEVLDKW